ncbi:MAG TPA: carbonic anhydrase [Oligoflexia bacterium]|nr:carbonic anhydrase [Oligoflexia bacterium]
MIPNNRTSAVHKHFTPLILMAALCLTIPRTARADTEHPNESGSHESGKKTEVLQKENPAGWLALSALIEGNRRYIESKQTVPPRDFSKRRSELAAGQKPNAIILSCSDSRVPPELIFDQGLGDIFVIRTAGHVPDSAGTASIEYAVEHLGVRLLVVLGHESCGAVTAALTAEEGKSAGSADLDALVAAIRPNLTGFSAGADKTIREPVRAHVAGVVNKLLDRSKILRKAVEHKELIVVDAIYNISSGKIEFWL